MLVKDFFRIDNIAGFNNLLRLLANQIGQLVNVSELSGTLGLNKNTVEKYLSLLEGTFTFRRLTPFFRNVRKELSKMPKIYAMDLGLRNFMIANFSALDLRGDRGEIAENLVFTEMSRQIQAPNELHFWRTQTKAEVDMVLQLPNAALPIEAKYQPMKAPKVSRSFRSFVRAYEPTVGLIFTRDFLGQTKIDKTAILFLPLWSLPFLDLRARNFLIPRLESTNV